MHQMFARRRSEGVETPSKESSRFAASHPPGKRWEQCPAGADYAAWAAAPGGGGLAVPGGALGSPSPRRFDQPAELWLVPDRVQIAIPVEQVQAESLAQGRSQQAKRFPAVVGVLAGRQRVDAGELIDGERLRIPPQSFPGVSVRGLAPAEPGVQHPPAGTRRHVVRVEGEDRVQGRDGLLGAAEVLGKDVRLVLEGRPIARVELQGASRNPPGPPAGRAAGGPGPAPSSRVRRAVHLASPPLDLAGRPRGPLASRGPWPAGNRREAGASGRSGHASSRPRPGEDHPDGTSRGPGCSTPAVARAATGSLRRRRHGPADSCPVPGRPGLGKGRARGPPATRRRPCRNIPRPPSRFPSSA